jgi:DNA polymerase-1
MIELTIAQNFGIDVDDEERKRQLEREEKRLSETEKELYRLAGKEVNPQSPKQMKEFLYDDLGLPKQYHPKRKNLTADEDAIKKLIKRCPSHAEILQKILDYRASQKLIGSFLKSRSRDDGKMETSFDISGTKNGRITSSKTLWDTGGNMQQISRSEIRRIYIPPKDKGEDYAWIKCDLSQAEVRFVIWDAKISTLIERYLDDPFFDIHTWNASENVFQKPPEEITKDERYIAKSGVHGGNYGLGERKAAAIYEISVNDARRAINGYRDALSPNLQNWWTEIEQEVNSTRTLRNLFGRRRQFLGRLDNELYRSAYSFKPQSTVADVVNRAFRLSRRVLSSCGWWPVLQVHDEIDIVGPRRTYREAARKLRSIIEYPLQFPDVKHPLVIPCEMSIGPNWYDQEDIDLREL